VSAAESGFSTGIPEEFRDFECKRCGACCRKHGTVRLTEAETEAIAQYLHIETGEFTDRYTDLLPDRSALTLTELENGDCIFYDEENGCRIHPVKPAQCRKFPFFWRFPGWDDVCEGGKDLKMRKMRVMLSEERKQPDQMEG